MRQAYYNMEVPWKADVPDWMMLEDFFKLLLKYFYIIELLATPIFTDNTDSR